MNIKVEIIDKVTQQRVAQKILHFEQQIPIEYVMACYMGQTLWELSYDEDNQVRVTKDGKIWHQETL